MEKLRIVVGGFIGLYPTGGVTWDYIQYPLGFHLLGHDVYYIEDTMQYSHYQSPGKNWNDSSDSIAYLKETMEKFGLGNRWAYRDIASGQCFGMPLGKVIQVCKTADLFINISASTYLRDEYLAIPNRVLLDSDPMFTQVQDWNEADPEQSVYKAQKAWGDYNYLFTFGENIHAADCLIPTLNQKWYTTRQPICLDYWDYRRSHASGSFTTIMNWSTRKKLKYQQEEWGQKDIEFEKFFNIPKLFTRSGFKIIVADNSKKMNKAKLEEAGWHLLDPLETIQNVDSYKSFIESSLGEFSVAKETYVKSNSGWFSCRSACYLAAGRPVITQETKWSRYIPSGKGLFAFTDIQSAVNALSEVSANIGPHSRAAREIAEEYFESGQVLRTFISNL